MRAIYYYQLYTSLCINWYKYINVTIIYIIHTHMYNLTHMRNMKKKERKSPQGPRKQNVNIIVKRKL